MLDVKCVVFLCLSLYILNTNAGGVSFIDPCRWNDSSCLLKSAKKALPHVVAGVPELGIKSLDPLNLKKVNGDNGDLKLKFFDLTITRLSECKLIKVERSERLKIHLEVECPMKATGTYDIGGKLFVVPVEGHGDCEIYTDKIKLSIGAILKEIEKGGKVYYKFASYDYKYEVLEKVYIILKGLYGGDEEKAEPIRKIVDESWREITGEVGKKVFEEIIGFIVSEVGKLFNNLSVNEIEIAV